MASVSMMASFAGGASVAQQPPMSARRSLVVARAAANAESRDVNVDVKKEKGNVDGRRAAMFAVVAAVVSAASGAGMVFAEEDVPRRGTREARKKFAPICVTMPTARVCNKIA